MKERFQEIDILRGIAILAMILIHTCYYFLGDKIALFIWNWSQFAVPVFIFCASYLFFQKPQKLNFTYFKKRLIRLIRPYYFFLLFFIPIFFLINPETSKIKYILQSLFVVGGVDINWMVLLFIYMTIIFPLLNSLFKRNKLLFILYSTLSIGSSILFIFYKTPFNQKYIMWLPWSVIPIFAILFFLNEKKKNYVNYFAIASGLIFTASYYLLKVTNHKLGMYENKYPPTIYFLSYGILTTLIIYLISKFIIRNKILTKLLSFLSLYSYSIYFIHYTILIILASQIKLFNNWVIFFLTVLIGTITTQLFLNKISKQNSR